MSKTQLILIYSSPCRRNRETSLVNKLRFWSNTDATNYDITLEIDKNCFSNRWRGGIAYFDHIKRLLRILVCHWVRHAVGQVNESFWSLGKRLSQARNDVVMFWKFTVNEISHAREYQINFQFLFELNFTRQFWFSKVVFCWPDASCGYVCRVGCTLNITERFTSADWQDFKLKKKRSFDDFS